MFFDETPDNEGNMKRRFHEIIEDDQTEELTQRARNNKYMEKDCFDEVSGGIHFPTDEN